MLNKSIIKFPIIYGTLAGLACFLFLIFLYNVLKINPLGGKKEVAFVFIILGMILSVWATRKADGGAIEFGKAFGVTFFTTLVAGIISILLLSIFLENLAPTCLDEYIVATKTELIKNHDQIIKNGIAETDYIDALNNIKLTSIKSILIDDFIRKLFLAIIPSLMISLYFRRKFID